MARIQDILHVPEPGSLFDRLCDESDYRLQKKTGGLSAWLMHARKNYFKSNAWEADSRKRHRRYLMAWFFNKPFSDLWYLFEACCDKNDR